MQLKDRLKAARLRAGLTQTAAAARVDMSQANYHKLESGKSQGSVKLLELALLFGVNPEWLATGAGEMVPTADTGPGAADQGPKIAELKDRLKAARLRAGLTQKDIEANIEGLKQSTYSELERGESKRTSHIVELALLFKVNPEWLATGEGEMVPATDTGPGEIIQLDAQKWAVLSLAVDRIMADIKQNTYSDTPETLEPMKAAAVEVKRLLNDCQRRNGYAIAGTTEK